MDAMPLQNTDDLTALNTTKTYNIQTPTSDVFAILSVIIGILGFLSNGIVCIVIAKFLRSKHSNINILILNQVVIDLIICVFLVIQMGTSHLFHQVLQTTENLILAEFLCRFVWSRFFLFSCFAMSTFNLTAMSIERLVAVTCPMSYTRVYSKENTVINVILVWIIAPITQYIQPIFQYHINESGMCTDQNSWTSTLAITTGLLIFMWEYFLPCIIMIISYVLILSKLRKQTQNVHPAPNGNIASSEIRQARIKNVTITLFSFFIVYLICWTPNQITFLAFNFGVSLNFQGGWYYFTVFAAFCNSFTNPFILLSVQLA
ncbi:galanin receptor 2b-like [Amphiura filiformis]|uniref:galanin receptor 2b-like n=1 Tax=Amphiura filiformis TaxID=82378 RepID=UPI003B226F09